MQKLKITLFISIVFNAIFLHIILHDPENNNFDKEYTKKIDSLESELQFIVRRKDSIERKIDTIYIEIGKNEKNYEEARNTIINNSPDDDYIFFVDYLRKNNTRLHSADNY